MPTIKEYNTKLKLLKNTEKMTRTMKMVSASKLRKAQQRQAQGKFYEDKIIELISRLTSSMENRSHPLLNPHESVQNALILVITSDKGLCGGFNNNINKNVLRWLEENQHRYKNIHLSFCGRRGYMFFKSRTKVSQFYDKITTNPSFSESIKIGQDLERGFLSNLFDEIFINYNVFQSPLVQKSHFEKILPIQTENLSTQSFRTSDYLFEPDRESLLNKLIPRYLYYRIYFALLENAAGEHGARMTAMDNATRNASEFIDRISLLRNRARQAEITTELIEVISGSEALK